MVHLAPQRIMSCSKEIETLNEGHRNISFPESRANRAN